MTDPIHRGKIAPWTIPNQRAASRQGWNVFNSGQDNARIEREDERQMFSGDDKVWEFLAMEAARGKDLARRALLHVAIHNPTEFAQISKHLDDITI